MSDARNTVEQWVKGFASSVRADTTASEGLENFSLGKKKADYSDVVAHLCEMMSPGGRKKSMKHWRRLACQHLGITKMGAKRWEAIVSFGVEHDMFSVEQCGSGRNAYQTLVPVKVEAPEPVQQIAADPRPDREDDDEGPPTIAGSGPSMLPCGHFDWDTEAAHEAARAEGKCCAGWKHQPSWRVKGLTHPVPVGKRRTVERQEGPGWGGLCCDPETGLYIGGLANNCSRYHDGPERCVVHQTPRDQGGKPSKREGRS